jgi:hypothetical protein
MKWVVSNDDVDDVVVVVILILIIPSPFITRALNDPHSFCPRRGVLVLDVLLNPGHTLLIHLLN